MLFNSFEFLLFLPIVFLLYWFVFRGRRWQNLLIVIASYVFYGWWDWRFLFLLVIADNCADIVNQSWDHYASLSGLQLLLLGVFFTFQIYCDFSGYSDIAIGCARLFGFHLMRNFNFPYFSRSIPEFWRRWHISLTTWFRDYIYFPLGGSRCSKWKVIRNVYIVWAVSGLWHGANWTFICWGLFHATLLAVYNLLGINTKYKNIVAYKRFLPKFKELMQMSLTFSLAVIGWIIFRAKSMSQAADFLVSMFTNHFWGYTGGKRILLVCLASCFIMMVAEWLQRDKQHALQFSGNNNLFVRYSMARWAVYAALVVMMVLFSGQIQTFIYFQF